MPSFHPTPATSRQLDAIPKHALIPDSGSCLPFSTAGRHLDSRRQPQTKLLAPYCGACCYRHSSRLIFYVYWLMNAEPSADETWTHRLLFASLVALQASALIRGPPPALDIPLLKDRNGSTILVSDQAIYGEIVPSPVKRVGCCIPSMPPRCDAVLSILSFCRAPRLFPGDVVGAPASA